MEAVPVDPRDVESEVDDPTYRVSFWAQGRATEFDVIGAADVEEVLAWARGRATGDQTFTLHAIVHRTSIRLRGTDPTRSSP